EGHRRVGDDRCHSRGAQRDRGRALAPRCASHRHAVHLRTGMARDQRMSNAFAQPTLRLSQAQYLVIVGHCYDGLPDEACGLMLGPMVDGEATGRLTEARPCRNADASARTYTVDPKDMLAAMRAAEASGTEIVGVWHSHTHTDAYPSRTDVRQAVDPAWL